MSEKSDSSTRCPDCRSTEVLTVTLTVDGSPISFARCNACDWKRWNRQGETVDLSTVLSEASSR